MYRTRRGEREEGEKRERDGEKRFIYAGRPVRSKDVLMEGSKCVILVDTPLLHGVYVFGETIVPIGLKERWC